MQQGQSDLASITCPSQNPQEEKNSDSKVAYTYSNFFISRWLFNFLHSSVQCASWRCDNLEHADCQLLNSCCLGLFLSTQIHVLILILANRVGLILLSSHRLALLLPNHENFLLGSLLQDLVVRLDVSFIASWPDSSTMTCSFCNEAGVARLGDLGCSRVVNHYGGRLSLIRCSLLQSSPDFCLTVPLQKHEDLDPWDLEDWSWVDVANCSFAMTYSILILICESSSLYRPMARGILLLFLQPLWLPVQLEPFLGPFVLSRFLYPLDVHRQYCSSLSIK